MIAALLLALAMDATDNPDATCRIEATVYKVMPDRPAALIRISYLDEGCGWGPPTFEFSTATVSAREVYSDEEDQRCEGVPEPRTGPKDPCEDGCPCLTFMAWVRGRPGRHVIRVWGENEGYAELKVRLR